VKDEETKVETSIHLPLETFKRIIDMLQVGCDNTHICFADSEESSKGSKDKRKLVVRDMFLDDVVKTEEMIEELKIEISNLKNNKQ